MTKIAYVSPVFDEKNTYRENVLVDYLKREKSIEVFFYHKKLPSTDITRSCRGLKIKEFYLYLSSYFMLTKYDYIILSDLRQIAPILFGLMKVFSSSKIIIEHEQRNFGKSVLGRIISLILYIPSLILYMRADIIRSPNCFSTAYLKHFWFKHEKIKELPLAVSQSFDANRQSIKRNSSLAILWSGKRFYEKSGGLLIKYVKCHTEATLTIVTSDKLRLSHERIKIIPLQTSAEFQRLTKSHDVCVYLSPTQTIFDTSASGLPTVIPRSFVPLNVHTVNKFIFFDCETSNNGVVVEIEKNYQAMEKTLKNLRLNNLEYYSFKADQLWREYE